MAVPFRRARFLTLLLPFALCSCDSLLLYSESDMNAMGLKAYAEETGKFKQISGTAQAKMVNEVGRRIAQACGKQYEWEFKLLDAPDVVNAFALPGGKIAVYSGLLKVAPDPDSLAAVLGHEIAHATLQHGNKRMSQAKIAGLSMAATQLILDGAWEKGSKESKALVLGGLGVAVQGTVLLPYSRSHESEADAQGLEYLMRAGYDPQAAPKLWERMHQLSGGGDKSVIDRFMSTHPHSLDRAEALRKLIPVLQQKLANEKK
ncbi:MAG: M48 family metalloprotease [Planctomycetes bacterium]|nr:M48 family metalloprotease [Planctomycetota bacterium]